MSNSPQKRSAPTLKREGSAMKRLRAQASGTASSVSTRVHGLLGSHGGARSSQAPVATSLGDLDIDALLGPSPSASVSASPGKTTPTASSSQGPEVLLRQDNLDDLLNVPFALDEGAPRDDGKSSTLEVRRHRLTGFNAAAALLAGIAALDDQQRQDNSKATSSTGNSKAKRKRSMLSVSAPYVLRVCASLTRINRNSPFCAGSTCRRYTYGR